MKNLFTLVSALAMTCTMVFASMDSPRHHALGKEYGKQMIQTAIQSSDDTRVANIISVFDKIEKELTNNLSNEDQLRSLVAGFKEGATAVCKEYGINLEFAEQQTRAFGDAILEMFDHQLEEEYY